MTKQLLFFFPLSNTFTVKTNQNYLKTFESLFSQEAISRLISYINLGLKYSLLLKFIMISYVYMCNLNMYSNIYDNLFQSVLYHLPVNLEAKSEFPYTVQNQIMTECYCEQNCSLAEHDIIKIKMFKDIPLLQPSIFCSLKNSVQLLQLVYVTQRHKDLSPILSNYF